MQFGLPINDASFNEFASRKKSTFRSGQYSTIKLKPGIKLIRLIDHKLSHKLGNHEFWFLEHDFQKLKKLAEADLKTQQAAPNKAVAQNRLEVYLKFQLRDYLAISRQWSDLDGIVRITTPHNPLIALVGPAKKQPYFYSDFNHKGYKESEERVSRANKSGIGLPSGKHAKTASQVAESAGISLPGGITQFIIDFNNPANKKAAIGLPLLKKEKIVF